MVGVSHLRLGEPLKSTLESMDPRVMVEWLDDHCFDHIPKTHLPNLNPMAYFFFGYLETRTNQAPQSTKDSFITTIME